MEARVVGGHAALLLAALLACDVTPSRPAATDPSIATTAVAPPPDAPSDPPQGVERSRVVLVTLDGVRWEDVFVGTNNEPAPGEVTMPSLQRLVRERGVALGGPGCTHDVRASGPSFISLPGYLEMFTGKPSACTHNGCGPVATATVIDDAREAAAGPGDVAVFASWSTYAHAVARDASSIFLSAGAHVPPAASANDDATLSSFLVAGAASPGFPGHGDYRPDVHTARIALHYLEAVKPRVLVVGLGDADEQAHRGDIAGYRRAIREADDFIADVDRALSRMGDEGKRTAVLVTTDHGRAYSLRAHGPGFPESQRVFVAAFGAGISQRGIVCASEPLRLAHVAGAMRTLLDLSGEPGPLTAEIVAAAP